MSNYIYYYNYISIPIYWFFTPFLSFIFYFLPLLVLFVHFTHLCRHGKEIQLKMWDTPGEERYRSIANAYFKGTDAFIIVFSLTDLKSFEAVDSW